MKNCISDKLPIKLMLWRGLCFAASVPYIIVAILCAHLLYFHYKLCQLMKIIFQELFSSKKDWDDFIDENNSLFVYHFISISIIVGQRGMTTYHFIRINRKCKVCLLFSNEIRIVFTKISFIFTIALYLYDEETFRKRSLLFRCTYVSDTIYDCLINSFISYIR